MNTASAPNPAPGTTSVQRPPLQPGQLSASQERALFERDRPAWVAYVAPRLACLLIACIEPGDLWAVLRRDVQHAVWPLLDAATQTSIRAARASTSGEPA